MQAGDCVALDRARWGFADKPFVVAGLSLTGVRDGIGLVPVLRLSETSPLVYSWEATEEQIYAAGAPVESAGALGRGRARHRQRDRVVYATRAGRTGVKARALIVWQVATPRNAAQKSRAIATALDAVRAAGRYIRDRGADRRYRAGDLGIPGARGHAAVVRSDWGLHQREIYGLLQRRRR